MDLKHYRAMNNAGVWSELTSHVISLSYEVHEVNIKICGNFVTITKNLKMLWLNTVWKIVYKVVDGELYFNLI